MDCPTLCQALLSTQTTALPTHGIMHISLHVGWAIVLAALALRITGVPWRLRRALGGLVAAWTVMPGSMSPAYWLGLAFQAPSLTLIVVSGIGLFIAARSPPPNEAEDGSMRVPAADGANAAGIASQPAIDAASLAGILLGWLLLLDTFALLPFPLYAIGFSAAAVVVVAVLVTLPWIAFGARGGGAMVALVGVLVLTLFVTMRLPTGNLWDALLDPLLWVVLQVGWLGRALRPFTRRSAAATRA